VQTKTVRAHYKAERSTVNPFPDTSTRRVCLPTATETFVALKAEIDTWRWAGVPFYLRTGKRLAERLTEIVITFEDVPHSIFEGGGSSDRSPNRLSSVCSRRRALRSRSWPSSGETMRLSR